MARLVVVSLLLSAPAISEERNAKWSELSALVIGKDVTAVQTNSRLRGRVLSVSAESMRMTVGRGEQTVARSTVRELMVTKGGVRGKVLLTIAGVVGGFFAAGAIFDRPGHIPIKEAFGTAAGGAVGGYLLGRRLDSRTITIRLTD